MASTNNVKIFPVVSIIEVWFSYDFLAIGYFGHMTRQQQQQQKQQQCTQGSTACLLQVLLSWWCPSRSIEANSIFLWRRGLWNSCVLTARVCYQIARTYFCLLLKWARVAIIAPRLVSQLLSKILWWTTRPVSNIYMPWTKLSTYPPPHASDPMSRS
jgi:hypothetical protein